MDRWLKGEGFINRYRFTGTLVTRSPLHIGTGRSVSDKKYYSPAEQKEFERSRLKPPEVSTVMRDSKGKPLIPGSTLRGVIRHWLLSILQGFGPKWANYHDYTNNIFTELSQDEQIALVKEEFSWLELLFGTPFHEGKIEFWDAECKTADINIADQLLGWDPKTLTYVDTSVAINPKTGTAIENLLYKAEVVPPGVKFDFNLTGQNLSAFEIGIILLALQGFNSKIYPIQIGARSGRGYGRMQFIPGEIYGLSAEQVGSWIANLTQNFSDGDENIKAGYYALPQLSADEQQRLLQEAKTIIRTEIEKREHKS